MMIRGVLSVDAVVLFETTSRARIDPAPYRLSLYGSNNARASALVRLDRRPASETDVVNATGEIVTRAEHVFSRWELRRRYDDTLVAAAEILPVAVPAFAPFPCVVRLFGTGTTARPTRLEG